MSSIDLSVPLPLDNNLQFVQDQQNHKSPLAISTQSVKIVKPDSNTPETVLTVQGNVTGAPMMTLQSDGNEAAIRYFNNDGFAWHVGNGGNAGPKNFFFWNQDAGIVITIGPDGTLNLLQGGLKVAGPVNVEALTATTIRADSILVNPPKTTTAASAPQRLAPLMIDTETGELHVHK